VVDRVDDVPRQIHYGEGRQPWDDIVDAGWGHAFAAANVLKYLRRDKEPEHSLESARWYYGQLVSRSAGLNDWAATRQHLDLLLTSGEIERLGCPE
jgi:hypothetical protein